MIIKIFIVVLLGNFQYFNSVALEDPKVFYNPPQALSGKGPRIEILPLEPIFYVDAQTPTNKALTCQTAGESPTLFSQLRWSGPNRTDNWDELSKKHSVTEEEPNTNQWLLEFKNPTVDDAGVYYCHGSFQGSDVFNSSILVKVNSPIKLENCPERQYLVQGSPSNKITCQITADSPKVTIYKDEVAITQSDPRYKWDNDGIVINGEVNMSDGGRYSVRVKAQLTGEHKKQYITVDVQTKPEILPFNKSDYETDFVGIEGESALLECKAFGKPQPIVNWFDPQLRNLSSIGGYSVNPERGTLLIHKVDRKFDNGTFKCTADNSVGPTAERNTTMAVLVRPQIVKFENKTVDEGSEVTFECRSNGFPPPEFSIRKQGLNSTPYKTSDFSLRPEGGGSDVWVYQIKMTAQRSNFGLHYCNATNRAGTAERVGSLAVNYAPDLSQTPPEQFIKIGKKQAFTCHIKAYPTPVVSWHNDYTQVIYPEQTNMKTSPDGQTHIVTITAPMNAASNTFICKAKNVMGEAEQKVTPRFTTAPGAVAVSIVERTPTTVRLLISVPNDGGDRIKQFKYSSRGSALDMHNPYFNYREDRHNVSYFDATPQPSATYTIKNLLPYYSYRLYISAVNDVGEGDPTEVGVETLKPTKPDPPIIIKPTIAQPIGTAGIPSDYSNGYSLKWSPPELDNGDPVTKYIIKYNKVAANALDIPIDVGYQRIFDQMSERPLHARLGPLEINSKYKIQVQAVNKYGDSEPSSIIIHTKADRPSMPDIEALTLDWLVEPSTPTLIALLGLAIVLLIVIDLLFCSCCQIGVTYFLKSWCCPARTNSVISDKTYT